ncbi:MAG TPA: PKD domain-containing protein [Chitinophagales bacterium]|nr:PKD domain-containing protein [Chitinophagales bacterium]
MKRFYFVLACSCFLFQAAQANIYNVTNNHVSGAGSFGNAITLANANPGKDYIYFGIQSGTVTGRTITLSNDSLLPIVQDTTIIDATTQPYGGHFGISAAKIQITSTDMASVGLMLDTSAQNSEIYGLFINHFSNGIKLLAGGFTVGSLNNGNVISNCQDFCIMISYAVEGTVIASFIGIDTSGATVTSPNAVGIFIDNSKKITIGGKQANNRNIISGCFVGIVISDSKYITIQDSYIGTDFNGTVAVPNTTGIVATDSGGNTKNIIIGGDSAKYANVISGNLQQGLDLDFSSSFVEANMIGTDITGTLHLGNGGYAVYFREAAHDNIVGGLNSGQGNVIAYNGAEAVVLENSDSHNMYVRGNRIFCNSQTSGSGGIVLNGGNQGVPTPTIVIVSPNFVSGITYPTAEVDIYTADSCTTCEGATYLSTVIADANGIFSDTLPINGKVTATTNDPFGNTSEFAACKDSSNTSCVYAAFLKSKNKVCAYEALTFTDQSISVPGSPIASWNWQFGDGQTSSDQSPVMYFPQGGTWAAMLIVTNTSGCSDTTVDSITVKDGVIANFTADQQACLGAPVHFVDFSVALGSSFIVSWDWDLGDGNHSDFSDFFYNYSQAGEYPVTLTIINNNNCSASFSDTVNVYAPPQALFSFPPGACALTPIQFTDGSIPAPGSTIILWSWNFGDAGTSSAEDAQHIFTASGNYLVTLIVKDNFGCSDTIIQGITILEQVTANFTWTSNGATIIFTNTSTFSANCSIQWTFGDGGTSNLLTPEHTYSTAGSYEVCLIVTDNTCNVSDTLCKTVLVVGIDDVIENSKLIVSPNPASQFISVRNLPISSAIKISLFNSLGKEISLPQILKTSSTELQLSLPELSEAIYWLRIESDEGIVMKKLVICQM